MILNPFKCPKCDNELQPENVGVKFGPNGELIRVCGFCGDEVEVNGEKK